MLSREGLVPTTDTVKSVQGSCNHHHHYHHHHLHHLKRNFLPAKGPSDCPCQLLEALGHILGPSESMPSQLLKGVCYPHRSHRFCLLLPDRIHWQEVPHPLRTGKHSARSLLQTVQCVRLMGPGKGNTQHREAGWAVPRPRMLKSARGTTAARRSSYPSRSSSSRD